MRVRSTGLGRTELIQEFSKVYGKQDYLVIEMHTIEPVKWHVRTAVTYKDIIRLVKVVARPSVLWWLLIGLLTGLLTGFRRASNPRPIEQY